jgi:hypothetical protein
MKHFIRFKTIYPANIVIIFAMFFYFIFTSFVVATLLFFCVSGGDQYLAVQYPLRYRHHVTRYGQCVTGTHRTMNFYIKSLSVYMSWEVNDGTCPLKVLSHKIGKAKNIFVFMLLLVSFWLY